MGSTLMATTSILLSAGLAAVISSTYSIKKPLSDAVYGAHSEFMVALKYVTLLTIFLFSFFCHTLSIRFLNQVSILICTPQDVMSMVTPEYLTELLEKGTILNTVGNRLFYSALPLLLWIFGPVLVFLSSVAMLPVLYNLDFVSGNGKGKVVVKSTSAKGDGYVWCINELRLWTWHRWENMCVYTSLGASFTTLCCKGVCILLASHIFEALYPK